MKMSRNDQAQCGGTLLWCPRTGDRGGQISKFQVSQGYILILRQEETAQHLKALADLRKEPDLVPGTHMAPPSCL